MDYFSELIESYNKLKKRTFKLVYLTEEDAGAAEAALINILNGAKETPDFQPIKDPNYPGLANFSYRRSGTGVVSTTKAGKSWAVSMLDKSGNVLKRNKTEIARWEEMLAAMGGEAPKLTAKDKANQTAAEIKRQQEQERLSRLAQPGGAFEEMGFDMDLIAPALDSIDESIRAIQEYCAGLAGIDKKDQPVYCREPGRYLTGIDHRGFAAKLSRAKVLDIDPETRKKVNPGQMDEGLLNAVADSNRQLMDFIAGKGDCDTVAKAVGKYKGRIVLFGLEPNEGVTIKPNDLQNDAMKAIERDCPSTNLENLVSDTLNPKEVNAIKGTMNELVLQVGFKLLAAGDDEEKRKAAFAEIAEEIKKRKDFLTRYAESVASEDDVALDLDETFEQSYLLEQAGIANDPDALKQWFLKELGFHMAFLTTMEADGVENDAKNVKSGNRADTILVYNKENKDKAYEKAALIGAKVLEGDDGKFRIGVGQKRLSELKNTKLGEIGSIQRMLSFFLNPGMSDKNLEEGYLLSVSNMIYGKDTARRDAAADYYVSLENKIGDKITPLLETTTYMSKGKLRVSTPKGKLQLVAKSIKGLLTFGDLRNTTVGRAIFKNTGKYADFENPKTQQRIAEAVARQARFTYLKRDIESGNRAAQDALVQMAIMTAANKEDMAQLITTDDGNSYAISHNEAFERIAKANKNNTLQLEFDGNTVRMSDGKITISFNQEGASSGGRRTTRSSTKISADSVKTLDKLKNIRTTSRNESTLQKFLEGQMRLLGEILNQSKNDQAQL